MTKHVIDITKKLISCASVTPADAGAQEYLGKLLQEAGFECHHLQFEDVPNLFARIGSGSPHFCYAGHTDVVPPGPEEKWKFGPFNPEIENGILYGRGASDMKGSVAAFTAAALEYLAKHGAPDKGSISLLITGDEEGPADNGTIKVLEWMKKNGHIPDVFLVGEPTNPKVLGEEIKVGRRGSLSGVLTIQGKQGHVAYPERAKNPLPLLVEMMQVLSTYQFDKGTKFFAPSNLELVSIDVGNKAMNIIPDSGTAKFNIRYNETWNYNTLDAKLREILNEISTEYDLKTDSGAESFITEPGEWTEIVKAAVKEITCKTPAYTTTGGTSDARFTVQYAPTVEFGPINDTIHQINENASVKDLEDTTIIFRRILELYFKN